MLRRPLSAAELTQSVHGGNRVRVDRVDVIDVVMHASNDRRKLGDQRGQEPDVVQLLEHAAVLETAALCARDQADEQARCFVALPELLAERWQARCTRNGLA